MGGRTSGKQWVVREAFTLAPGFHDSTDSVQVCGQVRGSAEFTLRRCTEDLNGTGALDIRVRLSENS